MSVAIHTPRFMYKGIYYTSFEFQDWKEPKNESLRGDLGKLK